MNPFVRWPLAIALLIGSEILSRTARLFPVSDLSIWSPSMGDAAGLGATLLAMSAGMAIAHERS